MACQDIPYNLSRYGFPLFGAERFSGNYMAIEDLILLVLHDCEEPRYVHGIPVLLKKNKVDYQYLVGRARKKGLINALGWILEETKIAFENRKLSYDSCLPEIIKNLESEKMDKDVFITLENTASLASHARDRRSEIARKWNVLFASDEFGRMLDIYR